MSKDKEIDQAQLEQVQGGVLEGGGGRRTFNKTVRQIEKLAKAGADINPEDFYPALQKHKGKSRDLPLVDEALREALIVHLDVRLDKAKKLKPSDPLFITQKGVPYSPNTLLINARSRASS